MCRNLPFREHGTNRHYPLANSLTMACESPRNNLDKITHRVARYNNLSVETADKITAIYSIFLSNAVSNMLRDVLLYIICSREFRSYSVICVTYVIWIIESIRGT